MFHVTCTRTIFKRSSIALNKNPIFIKTFKSQSALLNSEKIPNVKGFSNAVVNVPSCPVGFAGSTKDSDYKCPEYFCYNVDSFGESMVELEKYRLPAPSSLKKRKM